MRAACAACGLFVLLSSLALQAYADAPAPTLEVVPAQIQLSDKAERNVVTVVFRNTATDVLRDVRLEWSTDIAAELKAEPEIVRSVVGDGHLLWKVTVKRTDQGRRTGKVHFRVDYSWTAPADASGTRTTAPRAAFSTLDVVDPSAPLLSSEVKTAPGGVSQQSPSRVYLIVKNKSEREVILRSVTARGPAFVSIGPAGQVQSEPVPLIRPTPKMVPGEGRAVLPAEGQRIASGGSHDVGFDVRPTDRISPGKQILLFEVIVRIDDTEWSFIDSHEVDLIVFGESEFSGLLGVPAFLILPGVLMVGFWKLIESWWRPAATATTSPNAPSTLAVASLDFSNWKTAPPLAVLTIGLSVFMAFVVYPVITGMASRIGLASGARNYLEGYGTIDLFWLWVIALVLTLLAYSLREAMLAAWNWYFTFSEDDDPRSLIKKMQRRRWPTRPYVPQVTVKGMPRPAMLIEPGRGAGDYWVAPPILYEVSGNDEAGKLLDRIYAQVDGGGKLGTLAELFDEGIRVGDLTLTYAADGLKGPRRMRVDDTNVPVRPLIARKESI